MFKYVKDAFRNLLDVILWIILIMSTVGGAVKGYLLGFGNAGAAILGLIIGLFIDFSLGGFIATIISMNNALC